MSRIRIPTVHEQMAAADRVKSMPDDLEWRSMHSAPHDCSWVQVKMKDGQILRAHWAEDMTGEEQPCFRGWFKRGGDGFIDIGNPIAWRPLPKP